MKKRPPVIEEILKEIEDETGEDFGADEILRCCESCGCPGFLVTGEGRLQCVNCNEYDQYTMVHFLDNRVNN